MQYDDDLDEMSELDAATWAIRWFIGLLLFCGLGIMALIALFLWWLLW